MPSEKCKALRQAFFGSFNAVSPYSTEDRTCRSSHRHPIQHECVQCDTDAAMADRRSAHNALERQRREHLNDKFQELAHTLPSLRNTHRPSKTMIVAKSLEFVSASMNLESSYKKEIQQLRRLNESLRDQASFNMSQYLVFDDPSLFMSSTGFYPPMSVSTTTTTGSDNLSSLSLLHSN